MANAPERWFCCLADPERVVWRDVAQSLPELFFLGVPTGIYDVWWLATGADTPERVAAFEALYHLEIATIVLDMEEIAVVRPVEGYLPLWVENSIFSFTPAAACLDGCQLSKPPWRD